MIRLLLKFVLNWILLFSYYIYHGLMKKVLKKQEKQLTCKFLVLFIDYSAFMNEVLIPLDEELLNECIDIEKRHMAGLTESESKEKEKTILHCEKIYDNYCKRYSKKCGMCIL